jgi:hypothetical protein
MGGKQSKGVIRWDGYLYLPTRIREKENRLLYIRDEVGDFVKCRPGREEYYKRHHIVYVRVSYFKSPIEDD